MGKTLPVVSRSPSPPLLKILRSRFFHPLKATRIFKILRKIKRRSRGRGRSEKIRKKMKKHNNPKDLRFHLTVVYQIVTLSNDKVKPILILQPKSNQSPMKK